QGAFRAFASRLRFHHLWGWPQTQYDRLSAPADGGAKGLSRLGVGGGPLRLPQPPGAAAFLFPGGAPAGPGKYRPDGYWRDCKELLSGSLRRPTAAGAAGPGALRHRKAAAPG